MTHAEKIQQLEDINHGLLRCLSEVAGALTTLSVKKKEPLLKEFAKLIDKCVSGTEQEILRISNEAQSH